MIHKFKIISQGIPWADYKVDAEDEAAARIKATKNLQEDVASGSLAEPFVLQLMTAQPEAPVAEAVVAEEPPKKVKKKKDKP